MDRTEVVVARLDDLARAGMVEVESGGRRVLLIKSGPNIHALGAVCTHHGCGLVSGSLLDGRLYCPCHLTAFDPATGRVLDPPGLDPLEVFEIRVSDQDILLLHDAGVPVSRTYAKPRPSIRVGARTCLVVGAGAAGTAAVERFRQLDSTSRLLLVSREGDPPCDRTVLSKGFLRSTPTDTSLNGRDEAYYQRLGVETHLDRPVQAVDVAERWLRFEDGDTFEFDAVLLAPGSRARRPTVPGSDLPGVQAIRSRADALQVVERLSGASHVTILGGGFLGLEAAASLISRGLDVTVVERRPEPLADILGGQVSRMLVDLHAERGVLFHMANEAVRITSNAQGQAATVELDSGRIIETDLVLAALGAAPLTGFLKGIERLPDGAVEVDAGMRLMSGVWAAGDVALFPLPSGERARIEHWRTAAQTGYIAGANMAGGSETFSGVPFFWTEQYGAVVSYVGHARTWDDEIVDGDVFGRDFLIRYVKDGRVAAASACGRSNQLLELAWRMGQGAVEAETRP